MTPHEAMWSEKPDLSLLRVWGSPAYVHIPKHKVVKLNDDVATRRRKLDSKVRPAVFVGYADNFKAWRFYDPIANKYFVSRMATFNERHGDSTPTLVLLKQPQPPELELSTLGEQLSTPALLNDTQIEGRKDTTPITVPPTEATPEPPGAKNAPAPETRDTPPTTRWMPTPRDGMTIRQLARYFNVDYPAYHSWMSSFSPFGTDNEGKPEAMKLTAAIVIACVGRCCCW